VRVPGLDGAASLHAYARLLYLDRESPRRLYVSEFDEGGCAPLAGASVRCWERDRCAPGTPWRSAPVSGLPERVARVALGAGDGYAIDAAGALYTWVRRAARSGPGGCPEPPFALHAERVPLGEPVVDVGGGTFVIEGRPSYASIDCATTASGRTTCSRTDGAGRTPVDVAPAE
jgi:hypothetical protein